MGRRPNLVRYEQYCQNRVQGMGIGEAYVAAGYKNSAHRASQLDKKQEIVDRISQLQAQNIQKRSISIDWVLNQVLPLVEAQHEGPLKPADKIAAATLVCRLSGYLVKPGYENRQDRQSIEAIEVRQLTPRESTVRWADGIEEAAVHYGTDSVQELVAKMREEQDDPS